MCGSGTIWKFPHNQVFREVISDHQAVNFVPVEQVSAQSVPCMRWNSTDISNWFSCLGTCLTNSTFFHSLTDIIGNAWPEYSLLLGACISLYPSVHCGICSSTFFLNLEDIRSLAPLVINLFSMDKCSL